LLDCQPWLAGVEGLMDADHRFSSELERIAGRLCEPFKVGVVGQFRSGKSSIINALVGAEVALVDEVEATAAVSRYFHSDREVGRVVYSSSEAEETTIRDLIQMADLRRSDTAWLNRLERLEFGCPSRVLERVEFWDTPGLGGSELNQERAERFVSQLDAGLSVFDAGSIGRADIVPAMEELTRRGKLIVAVANKCEHMDESELAELPAEIEHLYPNVTFAQIVPFSARLALASQGMAEHPGYVAGSLSDDGGLSELISALEHLILSDPDRLSSEAAAGDARAVLLSFADQVSSSSIALENRLQQYERLVRTSKERADVWYGRIVDRVSETCPAYLSQALKERLQEEVLRLNPEDLKGGGAARVVSQVLNQGVVLQLLEDYSEQEKDAVRSAAEALRMNLRDAIDLSLSAPERLDSAAPTTAIVAHRSPEEPSNAEGQGATYAEKVAIETGLGLGLLALMIPGPHWPFAVAGALVAYVSARLAGPLKLTRPRADLRPVVLEIALEDADRYVAKIKKPIVDALQTSVERSKEESLRSVRFHLQGSILKGASPEDLSRRVSVFTEVSGRVQEYLRRVEGFCASALPATSDTLSKPTHFEPGQRGRARELWSDITNLAAGEVLIVDGGLSSADFDLLTMFESAIPLRIVTWTEPLASTTSLKFIEALRDLRSARSGSVSVIVPVQEKDADPSALPDGALVSVGGRGFLFSCSLGEALSELSGFDFAPAPAGDAEALKYERLWLRQVPGYRYLSL